MNKHILLVYNMGNSGGKYIEDICNIHEDVQVWQEANHVLKVDTLDGSLQSDAVYKFFMEQYQTSPKKTIGLIKAFDDRLIRFVERFGGSIIQTFRHPIGVVNFKTGYKMKECERRGLFDKLDTPEKIFEAHVEFYASVYQAYTDNIHRWPVVKLEDMKKSLREKTPYFAETFAKALKVDWREEHTQKVIALGVNPELSIKDDHSHLDIWESWDKIKKEIFLSYFEDTMKFYNYEWE